MSSKNNFAIRFFYFCILFYFIIRSFISLFIFCTGEIFVGNHLLAWNFLSSRAVASQPCLAWPCEGCVRPPTNTTSDKMILRSWNYTWQGKHTHNGTFPLSPHSCAPRQPFLPREMRHSTSFKTRIHKPFALPPRSILKATEMISSQAHGREAVSENRWTTSEIMNQM